MNEVATVKPNEKMQTITDLIEMRKGEIAKAAPKILDTTRLTRICLSSIQKNPLLLLLLPLWGLRRRAALSDTCSVSRPPINTEIPTSKLLQ